MVYHEFDLHPTLAEYVQLIWMMESENATDVFPKEQILPDGIIEVVLHYRDPFITSLNDGTSFVQPQAFAISQMRRSIHIESNGQVGLLSIRFYPWGAYHFFDYPIRDFLDQTVSIEQLWPDTATALMQNFQFAASAADRYQLVVAFLSEQLSRHGRDMPDLDEAIRLIRRSKGTLAVQEVAARVGMSKKQLQRKCLQTVGTTPKTLCRITRFLNVCAHLEDHANTTLTTLAHTCGYFDQAHFIKEFKAFTGFSPKMYFKRNDVAFADL